MSIVEDTERTRFCPQTDRRTDGRTDGRMDGQTDKVKPVYPPFNFVEAVEAGGIISHCFDCLIITVDAEGWTAFSIYSDD